MKETSKSILSIFQHTFSLIEKYLLILSYIAIPILILVEMYSRYFMTSAIIGIEEICLLIVAYGYYIGSAYAYKTNNHITVRTLHLVNLPSPVTSAIRYASSIISMLCAAPITWYFIKYFIFVAKSPSIYSPFTFKKAYYIAGPTIGWVLIFIYTISNIFNMINKNTPERKKEC